MWSSGPGSQSWRPIVDLVDGPAKATGFGLGSIIDGDLGGTLRVVKILRFQGVRVRSRTTEVDLVARCPG